MEKEFVPFLIFKCAVAKKKRKRMIQQMLNWKRNVVLAYNTKIGIRDSGIIICNNK
jgi:hypothetical protein